MKPGRGPVAAGLVVAVLIIAALWYAMRDVPPTPPVPGTLPASPGAQGSSGAPGLPGATPAPSGASAAGPSAVPSPTAASGNPRPTIPPLAVEQSRIRGSDPEGLLQWELEAASLEVDNTRQEIALANVTGRFYEKGRLTLSFTAPRATLHLVSRDILLTGGVRARAASGRVVEAARIQWLAARRLVVATGRVRFTQEKLTVRGERLESDIALRKTHLTGGVRVTVRE